MPQGPISTSVSVSGKSKLNITSATVVKASPGTILGVNVIVGGSGAGAIYDLTTNAPAAAAEVAVTPTTVGPINGLYFWPCLKGILVVPGTGQTVAISFQ